MGAFLWGPFRPQRTALVGGRIEPSARGAGPQQGIRPLALGAVRAPRAGSLSNNLPSI